MTDSSANIMSSLVTISTDEYADLLRAATLLDAILVMSKKSDNPLIVLASCERNINRTEG